MLGTKVYIIEHKKVLRQKLATAAVKKSSLQEMLGELCPAGEDMEQ